MMALQCAPSAKNPAHSVPTHHRYMGIRALTSGDAPPRHQHELINHRRHLDDMLRCLLLDALGGRAEVDRVSVDTIKLDFMSIRETLQQQNFRF
jgi:hypothetical protein